ncbi:uncharacterized mitochondrial protein AtMg00860-like [Carya illinoinensis]|uniref:uncharacterized mitochondrial protein AtMg00860-like n=1 Tax=Carya illinoinensis TaxID=32201 RepID=UPI001C71BDC8|nr:uncharacterized mitochondrial protein AtMg00860-like [Carya illinoinensis]
MELEVEVPIDLRGLSGRFFKVIEDPKTLPPSREFYHRIPLKEEAKLINVGPYRYAYYQKTEFEKQVNEMANGLIHPSTSPFSNIEDHLEQLEVILGVLLDNYFYIKLSKCAFGQKEIEYLGHLISREGVKVDSRKIEVIVAWPKPKTITELRSFLGVTGYYRKFVKDYTSIERPLTNMIKKNNFV